MKRSGAIGVVVGVVVIAALLMFFVVMPNMRGNKTVDDIAKTAEATVKKATDAVNDAGKQVEDVAKGAEEAKAAIIAKMARLKADAATATDELTALFDKGTPTEAELTAARAKVAAILKSAAETEIPNNLDAVTAALTAQAADGARAALEALEKLPTDPVAAKAALAEIKAGLMSAMPGEMVAPVAKPADSASVAEPAKDAAAESTKADAAAPAQEAKAGVPSFDVVRVEKDGSTLIAGQAAPEAKVEIVDGGKAIATTQSDKTGAFVAVLDDPLPTGDHSIVLKSTAKDGSASSSEEIATVSVPEKGKGEVLAMVSKPGEPSKILTMPQVAAKTEVAANTPAETTKAEKAPVAAEKSVAAEPAKPADIAVATTEPAKSADPAVTVPALPSASSAIAGTPPVVATDDAAKPAAAMQEVAKADPAAPAANIETKPATAPEVLVSAVELEGDKIFIAGTTRPGATVRVYADDALVAEVKADQNGRFVAASSMPLTVGNHTIRADVLSADGAKVEFRASVPFFRPEGDMAVVASNDGGQPMQPLADGSFDKARNEAGKALGLLKGLYADGKTPSAEELAAARSSTEIALKTLSEVHVADNSDPVLAEMASKASQEAGKALEALKALPTDASAVKSALGSIEQNVTSALKPAAERDAAKPAAPAESAASADPAKAATQQPAAETPVVTEPAKAPPTQVIASADQPKVIEQKPLTPSASSVIIRRGDTLWQISRRVYGKGVRYTTIYVANEAQITDPDRILPGQIFSMPGKWLDNAEELHKERMQHHKN